MTNQNSLKRLWTEYNKLKNWAESTNPVEFTVENCSLGENETSLLSENENIVTIIGLIYPRTEPFTECVLRIEIHVPITYPQTSLQVYIKTNISHPNIDKNGQIWCTFFESSKSWESFSLSSVITAVTKVIDQPESSHIANAEMYNFYQTNLNEYNRKMKEMVKINGIHRPKPSTNSSKNIHLLRDDLPPKDVAQQLLQYLDIFYPHGISINPVFNTERNTAPEYKPEVHFFFENIVGEHAEDLNYDLSTTYRMTYDAQMIEKANWTQIKQMLTCIARAERLSMYQYAHAIEKNHIKWILNRLKQLIQ